MKIRNFLDSPRGVISEVVSVVGGQTYSSGWVLTVGDREVRGIRGDAVSAREYLRAVAERAGVSL